MRVLRAFFVYHIAGDAELKTGGRTRQCSQDFPPETTEAEAKRIICEERGYPPQNMNSNLADFADGFRFTITDTENKKADDIKPVRHYGTDLLLSGPDFAATYDHERAKSKKRRKQRIE